MSATQAEDTKHKREAKAQQIPFDLLENGVITRIFT